MSVIDFDTDLLPFFAALQGVDEPYKQGEIDYPDRYDDASEQRIIVMIDAMRAYLETLTRRDELQRFHHAMSRVLGEVGYNRIYDDLGASTSSNINVAGSAGGETMGVDITAPDNTVAVLAPAALAANGTLAALIADINGLAGWPADVEAYDNAGKLGIRLTATGITNGSTFTITGDFRQLIGMPAGPHTSRVREVARKARDKGLDHFHKEIRDDSQP